MWRAGALYWLVQIMGWGAFCTLIGVTRFSQGDFSLTTFVQLIFLLAFFIFTTHLMRFVLIRFDWLNLKLQALIPRLIVLNVLSATLLLILSFLFTLLLYPEQNEIFNAIEFVINILLYTIFFILWSAIYMAYHLINKSRFQEMRNLQLEATNNEIELKTLRDQLNPHFLFNSLNSIRALVEEDPVVAKSAITTLSNLLRRSLNMGKKPQVSLEEELTLVKEYLELEKIRFEERLNIALNVEAPMNLLIPPFIIQTLAENGIKHGVSKQMEGGTLSINIHQNKDELRIELKNPGKLEKQLPINGNKGGIGLANTRRRLAIQYSGNAALVIREEANEVIVLLTIKNEALKKEV
jgi:two-component system, LytTR family, sensor kinase